MNSSRGLYWLENLNTLSFDFIHCQPEDAACEKPSEGFAPIVLCTVTDLDQKTRVGHKTINAASTMRAQSRFQVKHRQ